MPPVTGTLTFREVTSCLDSDISLDGVTFFFMLSSSYITKPRPVIPIFTCVPRASLGHHWMQDRSWSVCLVEGAGNWRRWLCLKSLSLPTSKFSFFTEFAPAPAGFLSPQSYCHCLRHYIEEGKINEEKTSVFWKIVWHDFHGESCVINAAWA